jgi:levansucrase
MRDGRVARIAGGELIMFLSAPSNGDPDSRHAIARIRLVHRKSAGWRDLGLLLPEGHAPGSREWAGSAVLSDDGVTLTLHFTAAGRRGEQTLSFEQRMFETHAVLSVVDRQISLGEWSAPVETAIADDRHYMRDMAGGGAIGTIKAFRDPAWFRDPADGQAYLLFTASLAGSASPWNGAIGIAHDDGADGWTLLPPLIDADGINNELERPHIVMHDGRYHLFWSTQAKVFADGGPCGPNGLYGMVANTLAGPWRPLNGTGLVLANPVEAPFQAYSLLVLSDLRVLSFADIVGLDRPPRDAAEARAHFGGTPAPALRIIIDGDRTALA